MTKTHLVHADRIERLILVLTIALYWAVSTGMQPKINTRATKKTKPIFGFLVQKWLENLIESNHYFRKNTKIMDSHKLRRVVSKKPKNH